MQLSGRYAEILSLIAKGMSNKEIANELGIDYAVTKVTVSRLFHKIGVKNRYGAMVWYQANVNKRNKLPTLHILNGYGLL